MRNLLPLLVLLALAGCSRDIRNESAVRQGVLDYLSSRSNLNIASMDVSVTSVVFRRDEADATVSFAPKGSNGAGAMTMHYLLERKGDRWAVKGRADSGQNPHGGAGANPHGGGMRIPDAGGGSSSGRIAAGTSRHSAPESRYQMKLVAILGGGPAGAFAAEQLASAGLRHASSSTRSWPGKNPAVAASPTRPTISIRF